MNRFPALRSRQRGMIKIMPQGDSMVAGWRPYFWNYVLAQIGPVIDLVGPQTESTAAAANYTLGDYEHCGFSGYRIDQIQARAASDVSTYQPNYILLQAGTNDLSQGASAATMLARIGQLIDTNFSAGGTFLRGQAVSTIPVWNYTFDDEATRAAKEAIRQEFNAGLREVVEARGATFVDVGGTVLVTELISDGVHPDAAGNDRIGLGWSRVLTSLAGRGTVGFSDSASRPFRPRGTHPAIVLPNQIAARVQIPYSDAIRIGSGSFVIMIRYKPSALPSDTHVIAEYGNSYVNGWLLNQFGTSLFAYVRSAAAQFTLITRLAVGVMHEIVMIGDAVTGKLRVYVNSEYCGEVSATWNVSVTEPLYIGTSADIAPPAPGTYSDLVICKDSITGFRLPTLANLIASYRDGERLPGEAVRYAMREGVGTSIADLYGRGGAGNFAGNPGPSWGTLAE